VTAAGTDAVAIVTGGASEIGREVARRLAGRGYAIVVVYLDHQRRVEATVEQLLAAEGTAVAVRADLADELDVERLFTESIAVFGSVDVVVHTTLRSASALYEHAARHLRRGGAIVGVSTAERVTPGLARRLRERDITVDAGPHPPGADRDVAEVIAFLDRWLHRSTR
jgi:3-oxoacyl-[acyl-carrier protein] reductase